MPPDYRKTWNLWQTVISCFFRGFALMFWKISWNHLSVTFILIWALLLFTNNYFPFIFSFTWQSGKIMNHYDKVFCGRNDMHYSVFRRLWDPKVLLKWTPLSFSFFRSFLHEIASLLVNFSLHCIIVPKISSNWWSLISENFFRQTLFDLLPLTSLMTYFHYYSWSVWLEIFFEKIFWFQRKLNRQ